MLGRSEGGATERVYLFFWLPCNASMRATQEGASCDVMWGRSPSARVQHQEATQHGTCRVVRDLC
jgi:hypothetical protein